jgi:hypothetical protein
VVRRRQRRDSLVVVDRRSISGRFEDDAVAAAMRPKDAMQQH